MKLQSKTPRKLIEIRQAAKENYYACGNYVDAQKDIEYLLRYIKTHSSRRENEHKAGS